jgi:hypothetical protein
MTSVYWTLRQLSTPRDRRGRDRLADAVARAIAADRDLRRHETTADAIQTAHNMMLYSWTKAGVSPAIAKTWAAELADRITAALARPRADGPP